MKKIVGIIIASFVVLGLLLLIPLSGGITVQDIVNFTPSSPPLAALVLLGIYCLKVAVMAIPLLALYAAAGMMFPVGWAIVLTYFCLFCELSLGYLVGRRIGANKVRQMMDKQGRAGRFIGLIQRNDATACFLTRLIPLPVPIDIMSMFYGATGVPYVKYITFSLLGISAPMIPTVIAGQSIANPLSAQFLVPFGISLAASAGAYLVYMLVEKRRARAKKGAGQ